MPDYTDFKVNVTHGDQVSFFFVVSDKDTGVPMNISLWHKFTVTFRHVGSNDTVLLTKTDLPGGGIQRVDPVNGKCKVTIDPSDTVALANKYQEFVGDIQGIDSLSIPNTLAYGLLVVDKEISTDTS